MFLYVLVLESYPAATIQHCANSVRTSNSVVENLGGSSVTNTRDHHVPRMYLRRFARHGSGREPQITAMTPDLGTRFTTSINRVAVERGFYWGTDLDGVPHHDLEEFLTSLEGDAVPAFRRVLDSGKTHTDDALPVWPPRKDVRFAISWWMAAQILRTLRQRERLNLSYSQEQGGTLPRPETLETPSRFAVANLHIRYIAEMIKNLAGAIFNRPWGIGFSDYCLLTGDVPVLVFNGQDHPDQSAAVRYWDVYMPMDPHRCLYLPGLGSADKMHIRVDHRFKLHPGHALGLNSLMIDTAVKHVFFHPEHDPTSKAEPAVPSNRELPQFLLNYEVLPKGYSVERRWLDTHPAPSTKPARNKSDDEAVAAVEEMSGELSRRQERFHQGDF